MDNNSELSNLASTSVDPSLTPNMLERAFPTGEVREHELVDKGISKVGYYAAFALMGLLSHSRGPKEAMAKDAVDQAVALVNELESRLPKEI